MTIAVAALAIAVPVALFVLWPLLRKTAATATRPADEGRTALEAEKVLALRALRELAFEHQIGHMSDEDYAELRARYEARASAILKRLDALPVPVERKAAPPARAKVSVPAPVPWSRQPLVLTGAAMGLVVFGVVLGVLVVRFTGPAPPEPVALAGPPFPGAMPGPAAPSGPGGPPATAAEGGGVRPIPQGVLEGMLQAAHASLDAGRYQEAIAAYKAVLKREPNNVDAITHLGVILAIAGHADGAIEAFDRALAIDPSYAHALWDKARVLAEVRQDWAGAIATWERFLEVSPPGQDREQAQARIREAKARLGAASAPARPAAGGVSKPSSGSGTGTAKP